MKHMLDIIRHETNENNHNHTMFKVHTVEVIVHTIYLRTNHCFRKDTFKFFFLIWIQVCVSLVAQWVSLTGIEKEDDVIYLGPEKSENMWASYEITIYISNKPTFVLKPIL